MPDNQAVAKKSHLRCHVFGRTKKDGTPVVETSLRIEIAGDNLRPKVTGLIESLKEVFNQESVMLSETESAVSYL